MRILGNIPLLSGVIEQTKRYCSNSANQQTIDLYNKCVKSLREGSRENMSMSSCLHSLLGRCSTDLKRYDEALKHHQLARQYLQEVRGENHHICVLKIADIANATLALGKKQEALALHQESLKKRIAIYGGSSTITAEAYRDLAICYLQINDLEKAEENFKTALKIFKKGRFRDRDILLVHRYLRDIYTKLGNHEKAKKHQYEAYKVNQCLFHPL